MRVAQLGILVGPRGRGSNLAAIAAACRERRLEAEVAVVIGGDRSAPALGAARSLGLRTDEVAPGDRYGERLLTALAGTDVVCLAGFLRLLPEEVLEAFPGRVLNIHPALLPKFGGQGMYGLRVHQAVLEAGEKESGCTVHVVTPRYDEGEILLQMRCPVLPGDTPETLAARVLELEHRAYPEAIQKVIER